MKELIFTNWNLWRIIRMAMSLLFIINGIIRTDWILIGSGGFLFFHALLNVCGSCAGGSCEIPKTKKS